MRGKLNPIRKRGNRNILCPHYSECLNHAVKHQWQAWACYDCDFKRIEQSLATEPLINNDAAPYYSISPDIYQKAF